MVKRTLVAWVIAIVGLLAYEAYTLTNNVPNDTLSEAVWAVAGDYPLLPLLVGILMGHFFWQPKKKVEKND